MGTEVSVGAVHIGACRLEEGRCINGSAVTHIPMGSLQSAVFLICGWQKAQGDNDTAPTHTDPTLRGLVAALCPT